MRNIKILFLLNLIMYLTISCSKDKSDACLPDKIAGMLPLNMGNKWIYQTTIYDSVGNITKLSNDTISIIGDTVVDCQINYKVKSTHNSMDTYFSSNEVIRIYNTLNGFQSLDGLYPYPVNSGNWVRSNDCVNLYISCSQLSLFDSSLNKTFSCYKYENDSLFEYNNSTCNGRAPIIKLICSYYTPEVGLIRQDYFGYSRSYRPNKILYSKMELMSYTLK